LAAVPSIGRAARVERPAEPGSDATRDLYERFSAQIMGYCLHQLGSREEAEDAVQTTFMNAFRGLKRGIVPQVESAWLFKIAHNVCLSRRRSTWRRGKVEAPNNLEVLQEVVPARERIGDELIRLPEVLEEMPESQRRAILLREWQGLSYREIAEELQLSQSAVETLIFRARRALAAGLEVEPERPSWRKRARHGIDAGGLLAALKGLLTGGTALKVAATVAVATTAAVAVSGGHHHLRPARHSRAPVAPVTQSHTAIAPSHWTAPRHSFSAPTASRRRTTKTVVHRSAKLQSHAVVTPAPAVQNDETAAPPAAAPPSAVAPPAAAPPTLSNQGNGKADEPKPAGQQKPKHAKRDAQPAPANPAPPAQAAHGNPGKGHDKQPPASDPQAAPQPAPAATDDQSNGQGQQDKGDKGDHGGGGGNGGNGHK
jgi:RNA polymerase sigma factor (sigma-70 family)